MEKVGAGPSGVRAGTRPERTLTEPAERQPQRRNNKRRVVKVFAGVATISALFGGCAGYMAGKESGRNSRQVEIDNLESHLSAAKNKVEQSQKAIGLTADLGSKGITHVAGFSFSEGNEPIVTLSTNRHNPQACEVEMTLVEDPDLALVSYDSSGKQSANHIVTRVVNASSEAVLLNTIVQNRGGDCK